MNKQAVQQIDITQYIIASTSEIVANHIEKIRRSTQTIQKVMPKISMLIPTVADTQGKSIV